MHEIDLTRVDVNLLVALDILLDERHVGRAARRLCRSPSAVSHTLSRLRAMLNDPLLVRQGRSMVCTPRAEALVEPVRAALSAVRGVLESPTPFEPATSERTFVFAVHDVLLHVLAPWIRTLPQSAPHVRLRLEPPVNDAAAAAGVDLFTLGPGVGAAPGWDVRQLPAAGWRTFARVGHPVLTDPSGFLEHAHVQVQASGHAGAVEAALLEQGRSRRVALVVPDFLSALHLVASSEVLFTGPEVLVPAAELLGLASMPSPVSLAPLRGRLAWPGRLRAEPGHRWFRSQVVRVLGATPAGPHLESTNSR